MRQSGMKPPRSSEPPDPSDECSTARVPDAEENLRIVEELRRQGRLPSFEQFRDAVRGSVPAEPQDEPDTEAGTEPGTDPTAGLRALQAKCAGGLILQQTLEGSLQAFPEPIKSTRSGRRLT